MPIDYNEKFKFRLTICPALELIGEDFTREFSTTREMMAASDTCALLLLFLQDKRKLMPDYSNYFTYEWLVDGEWQEIDEADRPDEGLTEDVMQENRVI